MMEGPWFAAYAYGLELLAVLWSTAITLWLIDARRRTNAIAAITISGPLGSLLLAYGLLITSGFDESYRVLVPVLAVGAIQATTGAARLIIRGVKAHRDRKRYPLDYR